MKKLFCATVTVVIFLQCSAFLRAQVVLDGGGLVFAEQGGTFAASNLADGAAPFTSSDLGPSLGIDFHIVANVNDLTYGNGNSWIGNDQNSSCGVNLGAATVSVQSIAFGRDNGGEPQEFGDRNLGLYTLQFTMIANPDESTPDGDWTTIGTLDYQGSTGGITTHLRHRYTFTPVDATGIRLLVPGNGLGSGTAIDELEVYAAAGDVIPIDIPSSLDIAPASGYNVTWDGNDGDHFDATAPPDGAIVPDNLVERQV